jgi:hypothetical protein
MDTDVNLSRSLEIQPLEIIGRLVDASNATFQGRIGNYQVVYKPIMGEQSLWDFPDGSLASREYAAYLVSEKLEMGIVPETVLGEGPFGVGMIQRWINVEESVDRYLFASEDSQRLRKIALFDVIVNNGDRKFGHLLPVENGDVFGCDHGVTFHRQNRLRTVLWQWRGIALSPTELQVLERAREEMTTDIFEDLLTPDEFAALHQRVENLLSTGCFPQPSNDWPPVPWPAY